MVWRVIAQACCQLDAVLVDQQPHQLGHGQGRVGVVELDRRLVGQGGDVGMVRQVAADDVLQRRRGEEIFLLEAQLLAGLGGVVGVEDAADALGPHLLGHGLHVVAAVERFEVDQVAELSADHRRSVLIRRPCQPTIGVS